MTKYEICKKFFFFKKKTVVSMGDKWIDRINPNPYVNGLDQNNRLF